jgi:hypothetical protein
VSVAPASGVGVTDIVGHASLVVSQKALEILEARTTDVTREPRPSADPADADAGAEQSAGGDS